MLVWKSHRLINLGLALALTLTQAYWGDSDSFMPLALGNSSEISHRLAKWVATKPDRPPAAKPTKPMQSSQHGSIHHKSIKKPAPS